VWETKVEIGPNGITKPSVFDTVETRFDAVLMASDEAGHPSDPVTVRLRFAWGNGDRLMWERDGSILVYHEEGSFADGTKLPAFFIAETEVSNEQYRKYLMDTGQMTALGKIAKKPPNLPVCEISFEDTEAYAEWAWLKIPTREQWVAAAFWDYGIDGKRDFP
jgi:hypothetical protein